MSRLTHGHTTGGPSPEYSAWRAMKRRCLTTTSKFYPDYGGRGISICSEWEHSFETFLKDIGIRPTSKHSLDRINNNGNYEPNNIRWATKSEQQKNRRYTKEREVEELRRKLKLYEQRFGPIEDYNA